MRLCRAKRHSGCCNSNSHYPAMPLTTMKLSRNLLPRLASGNHGTARILPYHRRCLVRSITIANKPTSSSLIPSTLAAAFHSKPFQPFQFQNLSRTHLRYNSTASTPLAPSSETSTATSSVDSPPSSDREVAAYEITFTCKPCKHRSAHRITKQGYHKGTVLITCPECKNRHVISDHLKVKNY